LFLFLGTCINPSVANDNVRKSSLPLSNGDTLYVGGSGEGNYTKIQDAIDNASDRDTVFVYNGTYYENIYLNKFSLKLIGEDKNTTIIDGNGFKSVILIEGNYNPSYTYVTITGFTIQNAGGDDYYNSGIAISSCNNYIIGNIIRNNFGYGIFTCYDKSVSDNEIINNIVIENKKGIALHSSYRNNVYDNYIANNEIGIYLGPKYVPSGDIFPFKKWESIILLDEENYIYENIIEFNNKGIEIDSQSNNKIFNNTFYGNDFAIYFLVQFLCSCYENYVYQNNIRGNFIGISVVSASGKNEVFRNNIIDNVINAIAGGFNKWKNNYWDDWIGVRFRFLRFLPYRIKQGTQLLNIDWHPAKEPYNIEV
jgi:parallel beta-helix repeat protein